MRIPSWRLWAPTGVAIAAVTALVVTLVPDGPATAGAVTAAPQAATAAAAAGQGDAACTPPSVPAAGATADYFLKVDGIPGESTDAKHPNEINIDSFLWGINLDLTACAKARQRATFSDISFVKKLDRSSPKLAMATATGQHIPSAVLTGRKAGDRPVEFLVITLKDVVVTSYSIDATAGSYPQDTFNLGFGQIQFVYTPQNADGRPGTPVTFCFNVKANRTC